MKHLSLVDSFGRMVHTSNNLYFSCRWLVDFYKKVVLTSNFKMFNCSGKGILSGVPYVDLDWKLSAVKKREIPIEEKQRIMHARIKNIVINMSKIA